jgi:NAD(P)-dependent dehydrogenase (short-subunit alcohol dehydrogenase family)
VATVIRQNAGEETVGQALEGRVIVLTGGAGGIARETAPLLLAEGADLLLIDLDEARLEEAARALGAGPRVETVVSRLESPDACSRALAGLDRPVYGLVHLAGVFAPDALDAASRPVWDHMIATNLTNAFDMAAAIGPHLDPDQVCRMVFLSSLAFRRGSFDHIAYTAAKGGIVGLVRALARRLAPGVLVNGLAPGIILTGMPDHMLKEERRERVLRAETMLKRFGEPREVATVIEFLLGPGATYITGQVINVDGGVVSG